LVLTVKKEIQLLPQKRAFTVRKEWHLQCYDWSAPVSRHEGRTVFKLEGNDNFSDCEPFNSLRILSLFGSGMLRHRDWIPMVKSLATVFVPASSATSLFPLASAAGLFA
jgi:hypothetical protein